MSTRKGGEIEGIQYMRGVASIGVVVCHVSGMVAFDKYFKTGLGTDFFTSGNAGVDLFFVISGFIIAIVSLQSETLSPKIAPGAFAWRRFIRIIPMMWLSVILYAALRLLARGGSPIGDYTRAFFLLPGALQPTVIWTLRQELVFYVVFLATFLLGRRRLWLIAIWGLSPFVYAALSIPPGPESGNMDLLWIVTNPANIEFMCGFVIGALWLQGSFAKRWSIPVNASLLIYAAFIAVMLVAFLIHGLPLLFYRVVLATICSAVLILGITVQSKPGLLDRTGRLLGDASYSIYLFHPHIVSAVLGIWVALAPRTPIWVVVVGVTAVATVVGVVIYLTIERTLLAVLRHVASWRTVRSIA